MSVLRSQSQCLRLVRALGNICSSPGLCSQLGIAVGLVLNVPHWCHSQVSQLLLQTEGAGTPKLKKK